jgi:hypothetical protein
MKALRVLLLLVPLSACAAKTNNAEKASAAALQTCTDPVDVPVLLRLVPDSAAAETVQTSPVQVEAQGCGFAAQNDVRFGPEVLRDVASVEGGTRIHFTIPRSLRGGSEVPPMPTPAGTYDVTITTTRGRSNARPLRLY